MITQSEPSLTLPAICSLLGVSPDEITPASEALLETLDFRYQPITGDKYLELMLSILKKCDADTQKVGAAERTEVWRNGWQGALDESRQAGFSDETLVPKFIRPGQPLRLFQEYVTSPNPWFEYHWVQFLRTWFISRYFANCDQIWEFGCGTGFNLLAAAQIFPQKRLQGSDFVSSAVELVNQMAEARGVNLSAFLFNMLEPDARVKIPAGTGVFTFGAIEQLAGRVDAMLQYLIQNRPQIVVHVEPASELYDPENLNDYLALRFQNKRGYTTGLLKKLQELHAAGTIELLKVQRTQIGSLYMEGYNIFVWRPHGTRD
jgi:hypothetical protein